MALKWTLLLLFLLSSISLPVCPARIYLKLHGISVIPTLVKKVITNLDSSKVSGSDGNPVVVLKDCEPELSYILAELFSTTAAIQLQIF